MGGCVLFGKRNRRAGSNRHIISMISPEPRGSIPVDIYAALEESRGLNADPCRGEKPSGLNPERHDSNLPLHTHCGTGNRRIRRQDGKLNRFRGPRRHAAGRRDALAHGYFWEAGMVCVMYATDGHQYAVSFPCLRGRSMAPCAGASESGLKWISTSQPAFLR